MFVRRAFRAVIVTLLVVRVVAPSFKAFSLST